jgi:hypothetical protein
MFIDFGTVLVAFSKATFDEARKNCHINATCGEFQNGIKPEQFNLEGLFEKDDYEYFISNDVTCHIHHTDVFGPIRANIPKMIERYCVINHLPQGKFVYYTANLIDKYRSLIQIKKSNHFIETALANAENHKEVFESRLRGELPATRQELFTIVVETNSYDHEDTELFYTDKTFQPILLGSPIIIAGRKGINKRIIEAGLTPYDDYFDLSFDDEPDDITRINSLLDEVIKVRSLLINSTPEQAVEWYKKGRHVLEENKKFLLGEINV